MKATLHFDFNVDKENNAINVSREFGASANKVWRAWTDPEILDRWWAPEPWRAQTKTMDFREGGFWHYAMIGPEGEEHWSLSKFISIVLLKALATEEFFADETGRVNSDYPGSSWKTRFESAGEGLTRVDITITCPSREALEQYLEMGFEEGFVSGLKQLDKLLPDL